MKQSATFIAFSFGSLSLLYSIYSDIIIQGGAELKHLISAPYNIVFNKRNNTYSIEDLRMPKKQKQNKNQVTKSLLTYLFVLDISGSMLLTGKIKPIWFDYVVKKVHTHIDISKFSTNSERIDGFSLASVKLSKLLLDLLVIAENQKQNNQLDILFSICVLGDRAEIIFPTIDKTWRKHLLANKSNILEAIKVIADMNKSTIQNSTRGIRNQHTNFLDLFEYIIKRFDLYHDLSFNNYLDSKFILTVFSDLIHDNNHFRKYATNRSIYEIFEEEQKNLTNYIDVLSNSEDLWTNIVLPSNIVKENQLLSNNPFRSNIWPILYDNFDDFRLRKTSLSQYENNLLTIKTDTNKSIHFLYSNRYVIENSYIDIKFSKFGNYKLGLEANNNESQRHKLKYNVLKIDNSFKENSDSKGVLYPGKTTTNIPIENGEKIRLTYKGRIPTDEIKLFIYFPTMRAYAFSLDFIKIMPWFAAFCIFIFQVILFVSIIVWIKQAFDYYVCVSENKKLRPFFIIKQYIKSKYFSIVEYYVGLSKDKKSNPFPIIKQYIEKKYYSIITKDKPCKQSA